MRENCTYGLMRGRWKPLSAVVMHPLQRQSNGYPRRVRRRVRERLQVNASALLYPFSDVFLFYPSYFSSFILVAATVIARFIRV